MLTCHGCKATFPEPVTHPTHRYGVTSVECWAAFNTLLAYESDNFGYPEEHRLTVDAYGVQHPQNIPHQRELGIPQNTINASIQSVGRHLIGLHCAFEKEIPLLAISKVMAHVIKHGETLEQLTPPESLGNITIADFSPELSPQEYKAFARKWAQSAWDAWASEHDTVRAWIKNYAPHY